MTTLGPVWWFGALAVMPLVAIDADRAARLVVAAIARGDRQLIFTPAARIGVWLHDRAPELWAALLGLAVRLLPRAPAGPIADKLEGRVILETSPSRVVAAVHRHTLALAERHGQ